ncbi:MAG: hypothetical protein U0521_21240 [Anaerolineae bacterium]
MKRLLLLVVMAALVIAVGATVVFAGSDSVSGTLSPGGPTEPQVALITTPNCSGGTTAFAVLYAAYSFTVDADGVYTVTEPGAESAVYVYSGGFDPANPATNCLAASNTNPISLPVALTAGVSYTVAVIEDTFAQDGMSYSLTISGPGNVNINKPGAACTYPLPAGSVVYSVPAGAPAFYDADLGTKVNFDLPAGTWWISEFTGDFAKVWIACQAQPIYIPANAVAH